MTKPKTKIKNKFKENLQPVQSSPVGKAKASPIKTRRQRSGSLISERKNSQDGLQAMFDKVRRAKAKFGVIGRMNQLKELVRQYGIVFVSEKATPLLRDIKNLTRTMARDIASGDGVILNDNNWCMSLNTAWILGWAASHKPVHLVLDPEYMSHKSYEALLNDQGMASITAHEFTYLMDNGYEPVKLIKSKVGQPEAVVFMKSSKFEMTEEKYLKQMESLPLSSRINSCLESVDHFIRSHCSVAFPQPSF